MTNAIASDFSSLLSQHQSAWSEEVVERIYHSAPECLPDTPEMRSLCLRNVCCHLRALEQVLHTECPELFEEYTGWAGAVLEGVGRPTSELDQCLVALQALLQAELPKALREAVEPMLKAARQRLATTPLLQPPELTALRPPIIEPDQYSSAAEAIDALRAILARQVMARHYLRRPQDIPRHKRAQGYARCLQDIEYHLMYLVEALNTQSTELFVDYIRWAHTLLDGLGISGQALRANLLQIQGVLETFLPPSLSQAAIATLSAGRDVLDDNTPPHLPSFTDQSPLGDMPLRYLQALLDGNRHIASQLILDAVEQKVDVRDLYIHVFQASQYEIGRLWQTNQLSIAQEHFCTAATQMIMSQLYPHIFTPKKNGLTFVATCVSGDQHELGVRMICDFFELEGWMTFYLGANTPSPAIIQMLLECNADVLGISATMTFHVSRVSTLIQTIREHPKLQHIKILVGGYPFLIAPLLWQQVGADASVSNPTEAASIALKLVA